MGNLLIELCFIDLGVPKVTLQMRPVTYDQHVDSRSVFVPARGCPRIDDNAAKGRAGGRAFADRSCDGPINARRNPIDVVTSKRKSSNAADAPAASMISGP
jgi:hypothetical protein